MYKSKLASEETDELFKAILSLKDSEECYRFFEDVCTISEIKSMSQRLHVAKLLRQKETFSEIANLTKASSATISRVNRCVQYGSGGYQSVLPRLMDDGEKQ